MKFATLGTGNERRTALVDPEASRYWLLDDLLGRKLSMQELIVEYDELQSRIRAEGEGYPLSGAVLQAPLPRPARNIMCVGKNYQAHAHEFSRSGFDASAKGKDDAIPEVPIIFTKAPETVIGPGADISYPHGVSEAVDYEAELGVIIGRGGRGIKRGEALSHVFGYTIINDMTARDLQHRHRQWFIGKSLDTFCPIGPYIVTADEVDPAALELQCWINGERRQHANTRDLIFDVPTLIETLSAGLTLLPGDVIATGTPAGVGIGFDPPRYLKPGDSVRIAISGLGELENRLA